MDTTESLGYLKGLLDGMDLDESKKETKIYRAMIGVLENLAEDVNDLTDGVEMMADQLDAVDEDLGDVEEYLYGDEDDDDCDCGCCDDDEDECQEFEIECPACHETFVVDEDTVLDGSMECPACGETLEFEVSCEDDEDEDETPRDTWATVRRLWSEAAGDHWRFYIVFASIVFYVIFNTAAPAYSARVIDELWGHIQVAFVNNATFSITWDYLHLLFDLDGRRFVLRAPELFDVERGRTPQSAPTQPHRTKAQPSAACLL